MGQALRHQGVQAPQSLRVPRRAGVGGVDFHRGHLQHCGVRRAPQSPAVVGDSPHARTTLRPNHRYGLGLYFKFLKTLAVAFFIMTLLSLPIIFINVSGERVGDEERDALSISVTSLGNNGLSAEQTQLQARTCEGEDCDVTYVQVFGKQLRSSTASIIITLCDVLYSAFFLAFVRYFHKLIDRVRSLWPRAPSLLRGALCALTFTHVLWVGSTGEGGTSEGGRDGG